MIVLLLLYLLRRTTWRPTAPLELARRRAWGQILAAAARMYFRKAPLFIGIGLLLIPIAFLLALLQAGVFHASSFLGVSTEAGSGGFFVGLLLVFGTLLTLLGVGLVQAATAEALLRDRQGGDRRSDQRLQAGAAQHPPAGHRPAHRDRAGHGAREHVHPHPDRHLVRDPLGVDRPGDRRRGPLRAGRRCDGPDCSCRDTGSRSGPSSSSAAPSPSRSVRCSALFLILLTSAPFWLVNVIGGIVNAVLVPYLALTTAYMYFDARARAELEPDRNADVLPAEFELDRATPPVRA